MANQSSTYADYRERQSRLAKMLKDASGTIAALNMNQYRENLEALGGKVNNDSFKIQVVGEFKNGKSTFINSFLGSDILPAYAVPCTAVINEVKYGKEKRAVLYFRNPMPKPLPDSVPEKAMAHIRKYNMKNVPPIEIPYDEIEDYAVIPMGKDAKEMLMESPYDKIELFYPLDLLENSVEIIDSPGLNEHETRTQVTTEYLSKADAVLFVFSANKLCGSEEMKFIENNLRRQGFEDIYFIVNRFDTLSGRDKDRVIQFAKLKLSNQTSFGEQGIFFVSALQALEGKMNNNVSLYDGSGMPEFEKTLSTFLINQKGKAKLSQPARELKRILNEEALFKVIPQQRSMLETDLVELKKRYEAAKPRLEQLNMKKEQMKSRIEILIEQMMPEIRRYINNYYADLNTNIPVWVNEYEPATKITLLHAKENASEMVAEISEHLKDKIEEEQVVWLQNTLQPLVSDKVANILSSIESNLENFFLELDAIRVNISGAGSEVKDVPMWQRVVAIGGGLLIGDIGVAALGGINGLTKDFAKGIALQIGAYVGLALFGMLNPFTIFLVIGVSLVKALLGQKSGMTKKVKAAVIEETLQQMNASAYDSVEAIVGSVREKVTEIGDIVVSSMDTEISEVQLQVQDIITQMEQGQAEIDKRKALLASCEEQIKLLSTDLDNFIFQLIG